MLSRRWVVITESTWTWCTCALGRGQEFTYLQLFSFHRTTCAFQPHFTSQCSVCAVSKHMQTGLRSCSLLKEPEIIRWWTEERENLGSRDNHLSNPRYYTRCRDISANYNQKWRTGLMSVYSIFMIIVKLPSLTEDFWRGSVWTSEFPAPYQGQQESSWEVELRQSGVVHSWSLNHSQTSIHIPAEERSIQRHPAQEEVGDCRIWFNANHSINMDLRSCATERAHLEPSV